MSSGQSDSGKRIQDYCRIIWGDGDYDLNIETDDHVSWVYYVQRDFGTSFGSPLTATNPRASPEAAGVELERMLGAWACQRLTGQPMTRAQHIDIFGGPKPTDRSTAEWALDLIDRYQPTGSRT